MKKRILNTAGIAGLILVSLFVYHRYFEKQIAYIDTPKVFNAFEMKKEMQNKYKQIALMRQKVTDSLSFELQLLSKKITADRNNKELILEFDFKRDDFFKRKSQMEEDNATLSDQYDRQILEQMSQYILDFGKLHNYDVIVGADGNGTLMYANEKMNISETVIQYINDKYKGIE